MGNAEAPQTVASGERPGPTSGEQIDRLVGNPGSPRIERNNNPLRARADALTSLAFEQIPKPLKSRDRIRSLILKCLMAAYDADRVEAVIRAGGVTWSDAGLMYALNNSGKVHGREPTFTDPRDVVYT